MNKLSFRLLMVAIMSLMLVLSGCGGDGGGDTTTGGAVGTGDGTETGTLNDDGIDTGIAATATTVAGKVTLSSIVTAKARKKAAISHALKRGKPGSKAYNKALSKATASFKSLDSRALPSRASFAAFSNGIVELYNSSHPDWVYPIAQTTTDADGVYTLETLINADLNGNEYTDGDQIPGGNYTLLAYTIHPKTKRPYLVALQAVVSEFAGVISGIDLTAQTSTAEPSVVSMLGVTKNTDGTQTWGDSDLNLAPNAAIQVSFSMAMNRAALTELELDFAAAGGATIPAGTWTLSADWLTATYYLNAGEAWPTGDTYTITVYGADTDVSKTVDGFPFTGEDLATFNVFGKSMKLTSVGTFSIPAGAVVDTQSPTAQLSSPTLAQTATPISIITPIRIASNERMDVNGLRLKADPSLGAQPGVLFIGKNDDSLYEYEFLLGEPLQLATTYTITVSGGTDLAGNVMNDLTASFTTESTSEGIAVIPEVGGDVTQADVDAAIELAGYQADVKDVFGKWVRSFSDRNLPQLQSVMSGDFFMEYSTADGFDENDINRDGLYDLKEFSEMMASAFVFWDFCGVTLEGQVKDSINIVGGEIADFEFALVADTSNNSQECKSAAPDQNLFVTLQKINGAWYVVRASEGIDTRGQEIQEAVVLGLVSPDDGIEYDFDTLGSLTFEWDEMADAASYALIVIDSRNPQSGFALILPPTTQSVEIPAILDQIEDEEAASSDGTSNLGKMVAEDFGFTDEFDPRNGVELYWQVAALGSNTLQDIQAGRQTSLPKDVVAISELWRFKIAGEYQELTIGVEANGASVPFSEFIYGYDAGAATEVTLTVTTPRTDATVGMVFVDGNTHKEYPVTFTNGVGQVTVQLNQGINHIGVMDGQPCWVDNTCDTAGKDQFVEEWFQVVTTEGIAAVITADTIKSVDAAGVETTLVNDGWDWYESADAVSLVITGSVDPTKQLDEVRLDVWNDQAHARASRKIDVDPTTGAFTVEVEIFAGENWVGIHGFVCDSANTGPGSCEDFNANFGINTAAGSEYVAPISEIVVTDAADSTVVVTQNENWGDGGMWDASTVTGNSVTITGVMEFGTDNSGEREPRYDVGSDGGWFGDRLSVDSQGVFSITVDLFAGWNYVSIMDVNDNWFHVDILTEGGKVVIRPEITTIDGTAFTGGDFNTTQCSATLVGTAMEGEMHVMWNGNLNGGDMTATDTGGTAGADFGGFQNFWEEIKTSADSTGAWTATVPLVGSSDPAVFADNFVDVFDKNWNWMGVHFINTGDCSYEPPMMSVTGVKDDTGTALVAVNSWDDPYGNGGGADYGPATAAAKVLSVAFPDGSTLIGVTSPLDGEVTAASPTVSGVVDLGQFPLTGTQVVRVLVEDPASITGPMAMYSSNASDPMITAFTNVGMPTGSFTVDGAGNFSVAVDLAAGIPAIIQVLAWDDMNAIATTGEPTMEPIAGFGVAVNGAVMDTGGATGGCDPADPACADGTAAGGGMYGDPVATSTITIEGTSNVAGRSISFELYGCGGAERYTVAAGTIADGNGDFAWTSPAITVYEGHNGIGVSNGPGWYNVNLSATNSNPLPTPVLEVGSIVGETGTTTALDTSMGAECGRSSWMTDASVVTISGTTAGTQNGQGEYHADGQFGRFDIIDGVFSFDITLYRGFNFIGVNDADWNFHDVNIETSQGTARPQFVSLDTTTGVASGEVIMTGTVDPAAGGGDFMPNFIGGGMESCDDTGMCNWVEFSSDPNAADWGALPLELSVAKNANGLYEFSFTATFAEDSANAGMASSARINIWVDGNTPDGMWEGHGLDQPINDTTQDAFFWKPGAKVTKKVGMSRQAKAKMKAARSKGNH